MNARLTLAALLLSTPLYAQAVLIETLTLNMTGSAGSTGVSSTAVLALGTAYTVRVSGTFEIGCIGFAPCPTDAEYYVPQGGPNAGLPFSLTGFDNPAGVDIGAQIDNVKIDWGPFNPARVYTTTFIGKGSTAFFNYLDTNYGDNVGELTIEIETRNSVATPAPATLSLAIAGLAIAGCGRLRER